MSKVQRVLLTVGIIFLTILNTVGLSVAQTNDIKGHWGADKISAWAEKGYIKGYDDGMFRPDQSITRAEFAALLNRCFGFTSGVTERFSDVPQNAWYAGEISKAKAAGYLTGYPDGTVRPDSRITREEAASMIAHVLKLNALSDMSNLSEFKDAAAISGWSKGLVSAVVKKGIIAGYPDKTFRASKDITRAEGVVVLDRAISSSDQAVSYDKAGVFGPAAGSQVIIGNANINAAGVTLQNVVITGNLTLAEGIGDGEATLKNVTVQGSTFINGGGANSIHLENCNFASVNVSKEGVRVVATGKTRVKVTQLNSGAILLEADVTADGFQSVVISQAVTANSRITLTGSFADVNIDAHGIQLEIAGGTVGKLNVEGTAADSTINLAEGAVVNILTLDAAAAVRGQGKINTAVINAEGSTIEPKPDKIETNTSASGMDSSSTHHGGTGEESGGGNGNGIAPLGFTGAYLTTINGDVSTTEDSIEGSVTIPVHPIIKLEFDRGVVRDYWDNNRNCISMKTSSGSIVPVTVSRIEGADAEKRNIFVEPTNILVPGTTYSIFISPDLRANNGKTLGSQKTATFTTESQESGGGSHSDTTAPHFSNAYPQTVNVTYNQFELKVKINEGGTMYYVVLTDGANVPSAAQVKAGHDSSGSSVAANLKGSLTLTGNTEGTDTISGLTPATDYDIYVVAEDNALNLQGEPTKVEIRTADFISVSPLAGSITVTNNAAGDDNVQASDVPTGATVKVYDAADAGSLIGSAAEAGGTAMVTIAGGFSPALADIYVTITEPGKPESTRTQKAVPVPGDLSTASVLLAVPGDKQAGTSFDLNITGAKDVTGTFLAGPVAVTVTSDVDGEVYSGSSTFVAGTAIITVSAGKVITAGNHVLTVSIAGISQRINVPVTVTAGTQYDAGQSGASISPALNKGTTSTVTVTLRDAYGNPLPNISKSVKIAVTVVNNSGGAEIYDVAGQSVSSTINISKTVNTDVGGKATFDVALPAGIDVGDGITIQIKKNDLSANIGNPFAYAEQPIDLSDASLAFATPGDITAGATFNLSINGAKDAGGADLSGAVAVTVTSSIDGMIYSGMPVFSGGTAAVTIPAGAMTTAGMHTLTATITGVSTRPAVQATVVAASQISSVNSSVTIDQPLQTGGASIIAVTLRDAYNNLMANTVKNIKIVVTVTNADSTTAETYVVDTASVTASTTISKSNVHFDGNGQYMFTVEMPAAIDSGDGIAISVTQNNGTGIGSTYTYP